MNNKQRARERRFLSERLESRVLMANAVGDGLRALYFDNADFTGPSVSRIDPKVDFNWGNDSPAPGIGKDTYSVRWRGQVEPRFSETYTFYTRADDGVRLWVDGKPLVDNWTEHRATTNSNTITLSAGQRYDLVMEYFEGNGNAEAKLSWSSPSQVLEAIPQSQLFSNVALPAPSSLVASVESSQVTLNWIDMSIGELGFRIERAADGADFTSIGTVGRNVASFVDTSVTQGTGYRYRVRAYDAGLDSEYSNIASTTPAAPGNLQAIATGPSSTRLTWLDNSYNESGYKLERAGSDGTFVEIASLAANVTSFQDAALSEATSYSYRVRAFNTFGHSDYSPDAGVTTPPTVPIAPAQLAASASAANQVDLTWADESFNEGGFRIERADDGISFIAIADVAAGMTNYSDTSVSPDTAYSYRVVAFNSAGDAASASVDVRTPVAVPQTPSDLSATANGITVTLAWTDQSNNEDGFSIERSDDGITFNEIATVAADATAFVDRGLLETSEYAYRVRAYNAMGVSDHTTIALVHTASQSPYGDSPAQMPGIIEAEHFDSGGEGISYSDLDSENTGQALRLSESVDIGESDTGGAYVTSVQAGEWLEYMIEVPADGSYTLETRVASAGAGGAFRVFSDGVDVTGLQTIADTGGWQDWQTLSSVVTLPAGQHVLRVSFESNGDSGYVGNFDWLRLTRNLPQVNGLVLIDAHSDADIGPLADGAVLNLAQLPSRQLNIRADVGNFTESLVFELDGNIIIENYAPFALAGDEPGFDYRSWTPSLGTHHLVVTPYSADRALGEAGAPIAITFTVIDGPIAPSNLVATTHSSSEIDLSWNDNSSDEEGFEILVSTDGTDWTTFARIGADITSYPVTGLDASTSYHFRVQAFNGSGSAISNTAVATTSAELLPPQAPSDLTAVGVSSSTINLTWSDNSADEAGFRIERSEDGTSWTEIAIVPADVTTYPADELRGLTTYHFRVRAFNDAGESDFSNTASAATQPELLTPAAPSNLTATAVSSSRIDLTWSDNSAIELGFKIERSDDGGSTWTEMPVLGPNVTSYSATGLSAGTQYSFRVRAYALLTESPNSDVATATTLSGGTVVINENFSSGAAALITDIGTWGVVGGAYHITTANTTATTHLNNRSVHSTGLLGDFALEVDASTVSTQSAWNDFAIIFGYQDANNFYFVSSNESNDGGTSGIFKVVNGVRTELADIPGAIVPGTTYHMRISRAGSTINAFRNGVLVASANDSTFTQGRVGFGTQNDRAIFDNLVVTGVAAPAPPPPSEPPAAPSSLTASAYSDTRIDLSWSDNSSDESGFEIERSSDGGNTWTAVATVGAGTRSHSVTGLTESTEYYFRVRSFNVAGASVFAAPASATTRAATTVPTTRPGPSNTGVTNASLLRASGSVNITTPGAIIENLDITGGITVNAPNVTIRNCRINARGIRYAIRVAYDLTGRTIIEDCEIFNMDGFGIHGENFTARRLNIHHSGSDGINITTDGLVESCWFHHLGMNEGAHADGVQIASGTNHIIRGNFFDMPKGLVENGQEYRSNAALMIKPSGADISNVLIEGNWLNGGNYTIYITTAMDYGRGMPTGCVVRNNHFGRDYNFGVKHFSDPTMVVWENNRWMDTGALIP